MATEQRRKKQTNDESIDDFSTTQTAYISWHKQGYNIIRVPLCGTKKDNGEPYDGRTPEGTWKNWQHVKQDEDTCDLQMLFSTEKSGCNIGVVHGDISGDGVYGSCLVDVDGGYVEIVDEAILLLKNDEISKKILNTVQTLTPRGKHIFLKYKLADFKDGLGGRTIFRGDEHQEVKLIARGGFTVEPPSKREDGVYKFLNKDFDKIAKLTKEELDYLLNYIESRVSKQQKTSEEPSWVNNNKGERLDEQMKTVLVTIGKRYYKEGKRHDFALHFVGILRRYLNLNKDSIRSIIEIIDPGDKKNIQTLEDTFKKNIKQVTNIITFKNILEQITNRTTADNIVRELKQYMPEDNDPIVLEGAALLLDVAIRKMTMGFFDQNKNAYAMVHNVKGDCYEVVDLDSEKFNQLLSTWYREETYGIELAKREWKTEVVVNLKGLITEKKTLHQRCVTIADTVYYDLGNSKGEIVKITKDEWRVIKQTPQMLLFKKLHENCEQIYPDPHFNKNINYLASFLNNFKFEDEDNRLFLEVLIPLYFLNRPPYPIDHTIGDEGSTKSTLKRFMKSLIDPEDNVDALTTKLNIEKDKSWDRNLGIYNRYYTVFDNVEDIPTDIMNDLCQWVTGFSDEKRMLYTNGETFKISGRRPIAITSILNKINKPDLLSRMVQNKVQEPDVMRTEDEVRKEFEDVKPKILGFIFKVICHYLTNYDELKKKIIPKTRLADFEVSGEIMSQCLGHEAGKFQKLWIAKKGQMVEEALDNDTVALILQDYLSDQMKDQVTEAKDASWGETKDINPNDLEYVIEKTPTDLHTAIIDHARKKGRYLSHNLLEKTGNNNEKWVWEVNRFGEKLSSINASLRQVGIVIAQTWKNQKRCKRINYTKWVNDGRAVND